MFSLFPDSESQIIFRPSGYVKAWANRPANWQNSYRAVSEIQTISPPDESPV
jgi:hypothetical protein